MITPWEGDPNELAERIQAVSDWGPFELLRVTPASVKPHIGQPAYDVRFAYHGGAWEAEHLTDNLLEVVSRVAPWRFAVALETP
ncbi:MAG: hypothetical protein MI723_14200 [Caulobacterales bacterium]|nr:hypothetical protein [Caulobacterales bacterium]